jgi:1,4-alpha-glucan branching enzyme
VSGGHRGVNHVPARGEWGAGEGESVVTHLWRVALLIVGLLASAALPATAATHDDNVEWNGVSHIAWLDRTPLCPIDGEAFEVRLQTYHYDLTSARVHVDDGAETWVDAVWQRQEGPYDIWAATVPATTSNGLAYYFEVTDGSDSDYLSAGGMTSDPPTDGGFTINYATLSHAPLGATLTSDGGAVFRVWAAGVTSATVAGSFNGWNSGALPMIQSGEYFAAKAPGVFTNDEYMFVFDGSLWKPDARARGLNGASNYNSIVCDPGGYAWGDDAFVTPPFEDMVVYQMHVGTFSGRNDGGTHNPATYRDVVDLHLDHLKRLGVNVIQLCPITEFPWDWSAGYNPISQWAPERALGTPDDLKYMIDKLHQAGIAVILDIVWNHFSSTDNYLWDYTGQQVYFDDPAFETQWGSQADFDRWEVADYFADSALYWIDEFHFDGFRSDGTDFLDPPYGQTSGWGLMQRFNNEMNQRAVQKITIAEQLPDNYYVTRPTDQDGAGYDAQYHDRYKYAIRSAVFDAAFGDPNMGELANTIQGDLNDGTNIVADGQSLAQLVRYVELHDEAWPSSGGQRLAVTIDTTYPHDDQWARGRTLLAQGIGMFIPGIPAFLQGAEFLEDTAFGSGGPDNDPENRLDWSKPATYADYLLAFSDMIGVRRSNCGLRGNAGIELYHFNEADNIIGWHRWDLSGNDLWIVASFNNSNFYDYHIGFPQGGRWYEIFNSQASVYGGNGEGNAGVVDTSPVAKDGYDNSAWITIPQMGLLVFRYDDPPGRSADLDNDGDVDLGDYAILQQRAGNLGCGIAADLDEDGWVTVSDVIAFIADVTGPAG